MEAPESEAASAVADSCPVSSSPAAKARSQRRPVAGDAPRTRSFFFAAAAARAFLAAALIASTDAGSWRGIGQASPCLQWPLRKAWHQRGCDGDPGPCWAHRPSPPGRSRRERWPEKHSESASS
eukprot:7848216-Lingulodinium_polyedra.AAC.1